MTYQTPNPSRVALRGDLLDFTATPEWAVVDSPAVRFRPDHWLLVEDGRITGVQPGDQPPGDGWVQHDHRGQLLMPGFIDTHVHSPQIDMIASFGAELLDWLNTYTFPAEARYADPLEAHIACGRLRAESGLAPAPPALRRRAIPPGDRGADRRR